MADFDFLVIEGRNGHKIMLSAAPTASLINKGGKTAAWDIASICCFSVVTMCSVLLCFWGYFLETE